MANQLIENLKQLPFETRVKSELKGLFVGGVGREKLKWKEEAEVSPFDTTFHSPLTQLWFLYYYAGGFNMPKVKKEKSTFTGKTISTPFPDSYTPYSAQVETDGQPSDILNLVLSDQVAIESGQSVQIEDKIHTAKRIMLAGCISPSSAASLIDKLQKYGFNGELDIYDLSSAPLRIIEAYKKAGFWKNITIITRQRDLFGLSLGIDKAFNPSKKEERDYDLIFADVLDHYLTDKQMERLPVFWSALAEKGMILLRDMAEYGQVEDNEKKALRKTDQKFDQAEIEFNQWVNKEFGFEITFEEIQQMRANMYSKQPPHEFRQLYLSQWLDYLFTGTGANMQLLYRGLTVPSTGDDSRIFPIFVFQKTEEEQRYFFEKNSNHTSIALSV